MAKGGVDGALANPDQVAADAALKQAGLGEQWLAFSKEQFAVSKARQDELDTLIKPFITKQLALADEQIGWARSDRERYESVFKPVEDKFVAEASTYDSPERQAAAAAEAKADVTRAATDARGMAQRQATGMGINPNSGRFAGIDRSTELSTALATAGAQNNARELVRDKGLALKSDVINLGRGLPATAAATLASGTNTGSNAGALGMQNNSSAAAGASVVGSGFNTAMQGYGGLANTAAGMSAQQSNEQAGMWNALGSAAGLGAGLIFSSKELKEDKQPIPEGEALDQVNDMPVEQWRYKDGVADGGAHVGPYAEDFAESTGQGDGTTIALQDAVGVTMKAVQDLDAKVERLSQVVGMKPAAKKPAQGMALKKAA